MWEIIFLLNVHSTSFACRAFGAASVQPTQSKNPVTELHNIWRFPDMKVTFHFNFRRVPYGPRLPTPATAS